MTEQSDLEERLSTALSRLEARSQGILANGQAAALEEELVALRAQLGSERTRNEDLIDRVQALKERQETKVAELEESLVAARDANAERQAVQQQLQERIEELRDQVARLTEANRAMVGDPDLVNTAMMSELQAMRAARRADVIEIDDILSKLNPHLDDQHAGGPNA